jgi:hypothetical protein
MRISSQRLKLYRACGCGFSPESNRLTPLVRAGFETKAVRVWLRPSATACFAGDLPSRTRISSGQHTMRRPPIFSIRTHQARRGWDPPL